MSSSRQRARDLLKAYDHSLEQQIVGRGSSHACGDEELWRQVEGRLREGDAQDTHCLGLDPLAVMEESLKAAPATTAAPTTARGVKVKSRGRLQGLAKAFEVLEQAALNLYLGPWRDEYKVVKMYSGTFTHFIKPVLSMPQIEKLFGLLGYRPSSHEQLFLQELRTSPASLDDLLRLSCAFYLARCECRLLQAALGKHVGEAQWELSVVRERQRGSGLQVAMDITKKTMKVNQPRMEPFAGGVDVDLYTDEHLNGGAAAVSDDKTWLTQKSSSPPAVKTHSDGMTSQSSSSASVPAREHVCVTTLNCQLTKMPAVDSAVGSRFDKADSEPHGGSSQLEAVALSKSESEANHFCSCLQSPHLYLQHCIECNTLHDISCALLKHCSMEHHTVEESGAASPQSLAASDMNASPTLSSSAARSSTVPRDVPESVIPSLHPISFHDCCNLAQLDPQVLCRSCSVFHTGSCRELDYCQIHHTTKLLGVCGCGKLCPRKPLVLCRYCGTEYCRDCWYRSPVFCACGETFDQSSSV
ncbi:spermatogenesis associated 2-like [Hippoglossus stenolepis]|uniref:spermatogenesis associated 2-like n=1 Tax=Hippoglossus stenolepis TaxID=195615 RepID=UPI00159CB601|nr:spermatogenesis associated 2-like [Hippoglossus stenolepis]XP_035012894.1 spermatogenesis associated 2-like [Hippoglossus stenolepis]XP_035012895.1 spermatogenesis associated 2-like [Hippoglossus stenolepis]